MRYRSPTRQGKAALLAAPDSVRGFTVGRIQGGASTLCPGVLTYSAFNSR
jgi:hypothetical protein